MKIREICNITMGQSPSSATYNENGDGLPFFQGAADFGKKFPMTRVWCSSPLKIAYAGDILISVRAPVGTMNIATSECCIGRGLAAIKVDEDACDSNYFWFALESKISELNNKGSGSTFKAISKSILEETEIPLPELEEQRKIAKILTGIENISFARQQQLAKLDELVKARFVEMFGDPHINSKGFPTKKGLELFKISNGKAIASSRRFDNGIPAYGGNGISYHTDDVLCEKDTIVIGRVGFQSGNVHLAKGPVWVTDNAMYISEIYDNDLNLTFLCEMMEHIDFTKYQDAGDLKKVTQQPFMEMGYIIPSKKLQNEYISFVEQTNKLKLSIQNGLNQTETLKKTLMQQYFG
ncbi:MAG: restriction endonuclease subunit S [Clostridiales bacterium]|nr:restriction endonuclease subunit S [Clostridiales bacterium]